MASSEERVTDSDNALLSLSEKMGGFDSGESLSEESSDVRESEERQSLEEMGVRDVALSRSTIFKDKGATV